MLSFIIPAYNEEFELPATLAAIRAAVGDKCDYEIIVVDDASTDATAHTAKESGAGVIHINRRQIAAARNAGARASCGEILFFVDADTRIAANHISGALAALEAGFSGGSARVAVDDPVPRWGHFFLTVFSAIYFANNLGAGAFLFTTRRNYDAVGGLDERYFAGEEVWFSMALKKIGRFKILKEPVKTSGRKLRMHSPWQLCWRMTCLIVGGPRATRQREHLGLWYDGKRENRAT